MMADMYANRSTPIATRWHTCTQSCMLTAIPLYCTPWWLTCTPTAVPPYSLMADLQARTGHLPYRASGAHASDFFPAGPGSVTLYPCPQDAYTGENYGAICLPFLLTSQRLAQTCGLWNTRCTLKMSVAQHRCIRCNGVDWWRPEITHKWPLTMSLL